MPDRTLSSLSSGELINPSVLPYLEQRGIPLIGVGNLKSTLSRRATVILDASVDKGACPARPTTSTTVALAIGDALAMTLMRVKVDQTNLAEIISGRLRRLHFVADDTFARITQSSILTLHGLKLLPR
jgi:hypothetical protein